MDSEAFHTDGFPLNKVVIPIHWVNNPKNCTNGDYCWWRNSHIDMSKMSCSGTHCTIPAKE